jgi:hypothetical protein
VQEATVDHDGPHPPDGSGVDDHPGGSPDTPGQPHAHESFLTFPVVGHSPFDRIGEAVERALAGAPDQADRYRAALSRLAGGFGELDGLVELVRGVFLGEPGAVDRVQGWIDQHSQLGAAMDLGRASTGIGRWVNDAPVLDLFVGVAMAGRADDGLRGRMLDTLHHYLGANLGMLEHLHGAATDFLDGIQGPEDLLHLLDHLSHGHALPRAPSELEFCLGELTQILGSPDGLVGQSMAEVAASIDPNTERIAGVSPDPVCAGATLTILSAPGARFDPVQPAGVDVLFSPCGQHGTNVVWGTDQVTVTVPESARSGQVYFGHIPEQSPNAERGGVAELGNILGACPMFGSGGKGSLGVAVHQKLPISICPDELVHTGAANGVTVQHRPVIQRFRALDAAGADLAGRTVEPATQVTLMWAATSDAGPATVRISTAGTQVLSGGQLTGQHTLSVPTTRVFTLEVTNGCGTTTAGVVVNVRRWLTLDPPDLRLTPGQSAELTITDSEPSPNHRYIFVTSSDPQRVSVATASVPLPAGQTTAKVQVSALAPGTPDHTAASVIVAGASGEDPGTAAVWVEPPAGDHRVVAFKPSSGTPGVDAVAVHAAMLPTGKALLFGYDPKDWADLNLGKCALWDPSAGSAKSVPLARNLFCAGHCFLGDGRLLVAGGQSTAQRLAATIGSWLELHQVLFGKGADFDVHTFNPATQVWTRHADMGHARWYPTCTTLPDGRALIVAGFADHAHSVMNTELEVFDGASNTIVARRPFLSNVGLYPFVKVLPGGTLLCHSRDTTELMSLDPTTFEPIVAGHVAYTTATTPMTRTYNGQGACVLLPLDADKPNQVRVLVVGGGGAADGKLTSTTPATNTAEIFGFDPSLGSLSGQAGWRVTRVNGDPSKTQTSMTTFRFMSDAVLLPDGTVAVLSGVGAGVADDAGIAVLWVESFDPETEQFTAMSVMDVPRFYHAVALLQADGSVLVAGSTGPRFHYTLGGGSADEYRLEVYRPPYLFRGPAPRVRLASTTIGFGKPVTVTVDSGDGTEIQRIVLLRASSTTHTNNMDQRCVVLHVTARTAGAVEATGPADGTVAPPGPYLLFAVKVKGQDVPANRIPSTGQFVMVGP